MKHLLNKEWRLAASPLSYIFLIAALMTMLPGYPILCSVFFINLGIFQSFQSAREANDIVFSALQSGSGSVFPFIQHKLSRGGAGITAITSYQLPVFCFFRVFYVANRSPECFADRTISPRVKGNQICCCHFFYPRF